MAVHEVDQRYAGIGVRLAWAVVGDEVVPVDRYAGVPPRQRPLATCPVCSDRVWFNLGPRKAHHFSHARGANCAVQFGETAAHLNTKFQIAAALRGASSLRIRERCCGSGTYWSCDRTNIGVFASAWDSVHVERGIGSLRPDILLMRGGVPLAAIEVFAMHMVSAEKAEALAALGLPWIEVQADRALYDSESPWTAESPLPTLRREPASNWRCSSCVRDLKDSERLRREEERRAAFRAQLRKKAAMVIDVYRPHSRHFREVIWIVAEVDKGRIVSVGLWKQELDAFMGEVAVRNGDITQPYRRLNERLHSWMDYHIQNGAIVDQVTGWIPAKALKHVKSVGSEYARRYKYDQTHGWRRVESRSSVRVQNLMELMQRKR